MRLLLLLAVLCMRNAFAAPENPITPAQQKVVDRYRLLNTDLEQAPPKEPDRMGGQWPYGALLVFEGDTYLGAGTVSHLTTGNLVTAAHCLVGGSQNPRYSYVVVYYDKAGVRQASRVSENSFDGREDIATLRLNGDAAKEWHTVQAKSGFDWSAEPLASSAQVSVWASTPVANEKVSETFVPSEASILSRIPLTATAASETNRLDLASRQGAALSLGNSGSLITTEGGGGHPGTVLGVVTAVKMSLLESTGFGSVISPDISRPHKSPLARFCEWFKLSKPH